MENKQELLQYTIKLLKSMSVKHEYTSFDSGAVMLDIWHNNKFYVIQFDDFIGVSEVNEETVGFDTIPNEKYFSEIEYKNKLKSILEIQSGLRMS
jgi:hypothetical protein